MTAKNHFGCWNVFVIVLNQLICFRTYTILSDFLVPKVNASPKDISCHNIKCYGKCTQILPMIGHDFRPPNNTIFFIETSCKGGLQSRQACAVESAAHANSNWQILVLFAGPLKTSFWKSKTYLFLRSMPNLQLYRVNTNKFSKGTPLEKKYVENNVVISKYPVVYSSDLLAILTLYKYGGLYLDLGIIVRRSFDTLPKNFILRESRNSLGSSIVAVSKDEIGRKFTKISIKDLADNYDSKSWAGTNDVYTRTLEKICHTKMVSKMNAKKCQGFHVLNHTLFYPIRANEWPLHNMLENMMLEDSEAYTRHVWNSLGLQFTHTPNLLFETAEKYCPGTYNVYKEKFGQ